ncbi:MAG: MBL fold metallo-hydrolase [Candidatus Rifleibacteriota bacterium]
MNNLTNCVKWLGHASLLIETSAGNIFIDPWKIKGEYEAELVLITHAHFDHLSPDDINKILPPGKTVIAPPDCLDKLQSKFECLAISPGKEIKKGNIKVTGTYSYNKNKEFHPKNNNWVGYKIEVDNKTFYIAGDTDFIPEMSEVKANVAILPIGGTYTMNYKEAAQAARTIKPDVAIPVHYGDIVGEADEGQKFAEELKGAIEVEILKPELATQSA